MQRAAAHPMGRAAAVVALAGAVALFALVFSGARSNDAAVHGFTAAAPLHRHGSTRGDAAALSGTSAKLRTIQRERRYGGEWVALDERSASNNATDTWRCDPRLPVIAVVTTIFAPSQAIIELAHTGIPIIVVGDTSTPRDWNVSGAPNVEYLSPERQATASATEAGRAFAGAMPWRHFGRKNLGYLLAIERRACAVWDFDDDNVVLVPDLVAAARVALTPLLQPTGEFSTQSEPVLMGVRPRGELPPAFPFRVTNPYLALSPTRFLWPRGYPVQLALDGHTGASPDTPELVRMAATAGEDVAVIQAAADGNPDVDALFRLTMEPGPTRFVGGLPVVLLAPGAVSPYNAQATLQRPRGYWAQYLPITVHGRVSDIWRSYIAQTVFSLCGLHVGFTKAWVRHDRSDHNLLGDLKAEAPLYELAAPLLAHLAAWRSAALARCEAATRYVCTAGGLLEHLVIDLYEHGVLDTSDVRGVQAWLRALLAAGYEFPRFRAVLPAHGVLSPSRPAAIPAHVAVHINSGFSSSIPLWHALHAAQYASVSYHVEPGTGDTAPFPSSAFPMLTRSSGLYRGGTDPPVAGFLAYSSFLDVWQETGSAFAVTGSRRRTAADSLVSPFSRVVLFQHDDAFVSPAMVKAWVDSSDGCMAGNGGAILPHIDSWSSHGWEWLHLSAVIRASTRFAARNISCPFASGHTLLGPGNFYSSQADVFAVRLPSEHDFCTERVQQFISMLRQARADGVFLEMAVSTVAHCALGNAAVPWNFELDEKHYGKNMSRLVQDFLERASNKLSSVFHPIKLSVPDAVAAAATLRDMAWASQAQTAAHASPTSSPKSELAAALDALRGRLAAELARASATFNGTAATSYRAAGGGLSRALGASLTAAAIGGGNFVVGVTGGSSTAGRSSWPARLQAWLRGPAGITRAEVRNAAQGTTSQLVTAPCIRALVGDGVDLLLWEFAMNDEYEFISHDRGPDWPIRRRVAEAYIRQAAQLGPGAMGFVHLWDLDIHTYSGGSNLPNKAFAPTTAVAGEYAPVFDRYFAIDVIGAMWASQLYKDKSDFLHDEHHPNSFGYDVILDMLVVAIVEPWLAYLDAGGNGSDASAVSRSSRDAATAAATVRTHPLLTPPRDDLFLPGDTTFAHCYMAMPPQFSDVARGSLRPVHNATCTATDPRDCDSTVNLGRSDAARDDRQLRFTLTACTAGGVAGGMLFTVDVRRISAILIDCGYTQGDYCLGAIDVFLDGVAVTPAHPPEDILGAFYKWTHRVDAALLTDAPTHALRVCAHGSEAHFSRIVVLEQLA